MVRTTGKLSSPEDLRPDVAYRCSSDAMNTFLIVDDHTLYRSGLTQLLREEFPGCEVREAANVEDALFVMRQSSVDLILLDIHLSGRSGFDFMSAARPRWPSVPIVVVSMFSEEQYGALAISRGAFAYVAKSSEVEAIVHATRRALQGKVTSQGPAPESRRPHFELTLREQEVMRLLLAGHSIGAAAQRMSLSTKTIVTHRTHLFEKLGVCNNIELALYAVREGLLIT